MNKDYEKLIKAYDSIKERLPFTPRVAMVLGSGLGDYAESIQIETIINYQEIEGFPVSTVAGHKGRLVFGYVEQVPVVIMQGRVHYYEGYSMSDVVLPVRLMKLMGADILLLTNASGGIHPELRAGDFMLMTDHISCFVPNPLIGENIAALGVRFPDMSEVYDQKLRSIVRQAAAECGIPLKEGVYAQMTGPSYESPAEIRMLGKIGADAVGMSTVCEAIAAKHMGMRICGISCVSNMAAGISASPLNHEEVQEAMNASALSFKKLLTKAVIGMGNEE